MDILISAFLWMIGLSVLTWPIFIYKAFKEEKEVSIEDCYPHDSNYDPSNLYG